MPSNRVTGVILATLVMLADARPIDAQGTASQGVPDATAQRPVNDGNGLYLELLGSGGPYSVNYEREIGGSIRVRFGFASWTTTSFFSDAETSVTTVPTTVSGLIGRGAHRLEVGGGLTFGRRGREAFAGASGNFVSLTGVVGYRYHRPGRGFLFRIGAIPFYGFGDEDIAYPEKGFLPSAGVSVGYVF